MTRLAQPLATVARDVRPADRTASADRPAGLFLRRLRPLGLHALRLFTLRRGLLLMVAAARSILAVELLEALLGFNSMQAGLALLPMSLASLVATVAVASIGCRWGSTRWVLFGIGLTLAGLAWFGHAATVALCFASIAMPMTLIGIGQGVSFSPLAAGCQRQAGS